MGGRGGWLWRFGGGLESFFCFFKLRGDVFLNVKMVFEGLVEKNGGVIFLKDFSARWGDFFGKMDLVGWIFSIPESKFAQKALSSDFAWILM